MTMPIPAAYTRQMRRARTVYGALKAVRPEDRVSAAMRKNGTILPELAALALFAVAAAGIIALRAFLTVGG